MKPMRKIVSLALIFALVSALAPELLLARQEAEAPPPAQTGAIQGTLVDSNGQPLAGYRLRVRDTEGNVYTSEPTGADGKYEVPDLPPGTYTFEIVDPDGRIVTVRMDPMALEAGTVLTQPLAIVPKKKGKGPVLAWTLGGAGVVLLGVLIANNNDDDDDDDKKMTPGGGT